MLDNEETPEPEPTFDSTQFPRDWLIHDRRGGSDRRRTDPSDVAEKQPCRRARDRRRRIDPTTFEKQYTTDELEFMNAMQQFKVQSGKTFPTYANVLNVARQLGYRQVETPDANGPTWR